MSYLSYDEFIEMTGSEITELAFKKLLPKATMQLDGLTNSFYELKYDLESECTSEYPQIKARAMAFKKALAATVEFMGETGMTSRLDQANMIQGGVSIGRTRVEAPDLRRSLASGWIVPSEQATILGRYGLLYRGL